MFGEYLKIDSTSIVILGKFNPAIIGPNWLLARGLISQNDVDNIDKKFLHNQIAQFSLEWMTLEVTYDRFFIQTYQNRDLIKNLAVNIFKILKETPIKAFGINNNFEFDLRNKEKYFEFGNKLCPLNNWNIDMNDPRLLNLEILEKNRYDGLPGQRSTRIIPSAKIRDTGVSIVVNDHYQVENDFINIISKNWEKSRDDSITLIENLWKNLKIQ